MASRSYFGTGIRSYDDPNTPDTETLAREFRYKTWSVTANATRQWGHKVKQQVTFGYTVSSQRPSLLPNTTSDPMLAQDFMDDVEPLSKAASKDTARALVRRISEEMQKDEALMSAMRRVGALPDKTITIQSTADGVLVGSGGETAEIFPEAADHIFVKRL